MLEVLLLLWFLLTLQKWAPNMRRAWQESRKIKAGFWLSGVYLFSALVSGLIRRDDFKES